jgi:hypothetical protein
LLVLPHNEKLKGVIETDEFYHDWKEKQDHITIRYSIVARLHGIEGLSNYFRGTTAPEDGFIRFVEFLLIPNS